jgi:hypothetical protein
MSKLETNTIDTVSGTSTLQVGSTNTSTITLGVSGDTINVPSGVTIANSGTATGFGGNNTPNFSANKISGSITASVNTVTKATFDNELYDTASAYDTSTSRFTVPSGQGGKYHFETTFNSFESTANNTSTGWSVYLYKNGSNELFLTQGGGSHVGNARMNHLSGTFNLSAGDYIEVYFRYNSSSGNAGYDVGQSYNRFSGFKLIE